MAIPNIFTSAAFDTITMTDAINRQPVQPSRIQRMGMFAEQGIATTSIQIDSRDGVLHLIPNTPRGGPNNHLKKVNGVTRNFTASHFPLETSILAGEIQNVREFGSTGLASVESVRDQRLRELSNSLDVTVEFQRLGALKGIILDADGSTVLTNVFTEFGISQPTLDFAFSSTTTEIGNVLRQLSRMVYEALGDGVTANYIHVYCGKNWFEALIAHPNIKEKYLNWEKAAALTEQGFLKPFSYMGFVFEEYYGSVGGVQFVADNEAQAFPVGVPGMYMTYFAPGDFLEAVNTLGLPRYAKPEPMPFNRGLRVMGETNPFSIAKRPKALVKLTKS